MKKLWTSLAGFAVLLIAHAANATVTVSIANAGSTGTTNASLAKLTGAPSTAVIASTTDTSGIIGVVVSGAGTTGNALIAIDGVASCTFDASGVVAGHYVQISAATGGDCKDGGATYPTSGQVLGIALATVGSGVANIVVFPPGNIPTSTSGASLAGNNAWTAGQAVTPVALTDGATISVNAALSNGFTVTLGGNRTLANPTGVLVGQHLEFAITQDGTGSRTLAYGGNYKWAGGTAPTLTTTAAAKDVISCWADTTSTLECVSVLNVH